MKILNAKLQPIGPLAVANTRISIPLTLIRPSLRKYHLRAQLHNFVNLGQNCFFAQAPYHEEVWGSEVKAPGIHYLPHYVDMSGQLVALAV
jgi:hypothetical protein